MSRLLASVLLLAGPAHAAPGLDDQGWVQIEGHVSVFNDDPDRSLLASTFGVGLRGGYRWGAWGAFGQVERNWWLATESDAGVQAGALNVGVGAEHLFLDGYAHSSLAVGMSVLLFDTVLDETGSVGFYFDVRPIGLRWPVVEWFLITFDPLSFALVQPALGEIPIQQQEYRTLLSGEFVF